MATRTVPWDSAEALRTPDDVAAYLEAVFDEGDPALIIHALGVVGRARGMSELAREAGVAREALYRSLSAEGNPSFATVLKIMRSLGLRLHVTTDEAA